jgi:hypothetical protein
MFLGALPVTGQIDTLAALAARVITEAEAAEALGVSVCEIQRLMRVIGAAAAVPVPVAVDLPRQRVEFLDLVGADWSQPFFDDTVETGRRLRAHDSEDDSQPEASLGPLNFELGLDDLRRATARYPDVPNGFIFHSGRCGSTLLSNLLSAAGPNVVIKEPSIVTTLVARRLAALDPSEHCLLDDLLRPVIRHLLYSAAAAYAAGDGQRYLKFAAWETRHAADLLRMFPSTPAVFVFRDPVETVTSLVARRPGWFDELIARPRSVQVRFFPSLKIVPEDAPLPPLVLFSHAWRSIASDVLALESDRLLLLNYHELIDDPVSSLSDVLAHLGQVSIRQRVDKALSAMQWYSKDPTAATRFDPGGRHARSSLLAKQTAVVRAITAHCWDDLLHRASRRT